MARLGRKPPLPPAVFINCPFDSTYRKIFDAIVFAVCALGFQPCCALDRDDGSEERLTKILQMVERCQFGIHDLSHMKLDPGTRLPRHNMPFELGIFQRLHSRGKSAALALEINDIPQPVVAGYDVHGAPCVD